MLSLDPQQHRITLTFFIIYNPSKIIKSLIAEVCRAGAEGGASGQGFMGNVCRPDLQIHSESKEV